MNKVFEYVIYVFLALAIFTVGYIEYLTFFDANPPIKFYSIEAKISDDGLYVLTPAEGYRYTDVAATVDISFVNGIIYSLPSERYTGVGKGYFNNTRIHMIPPDMPNGVYHLYGISTYKINPFATRIVEWDTNEFVINRTKGD